MKRKIIRLSRKNEINAGWIFLIFLAILFVVMVITAKSVPELRLSFLGSFTILVVALLYQGFEVIKE